MLRNLRPVNLSFFRSLSLSLPTSPSSENGLKHGQPHRWPLGQDWPGVLRYSLGRSSSTIGQAAGPEARGRWPRQIGSQRVRHPPSSTDPAISTGQTQRRVPRQVPRLGRLLTPSSPEWKLIIPRLPIGFRPCNALVSEKIPPVSREVRRVLVESYLPEAGRAIDDPANTHCLIRPYLGQIRHTTKAAGAASTDGRPKKLFYSLRNYPLHLDQMQELSLPVEAYAEAMADMLAWVHWRAKMPTTSSSCWRHLGRPRTPSH